MMPNHRQYEAGRDDYFRALARERIVMPSVVFVTDLELL